MKCRLIAKGVFEWTAQTAEELTFKEGDILLITDDSDQDWWMASQKPVDTFQEVKSGLVPMGYVEEAAPLFDATALYDYVPNTDEEIEIKEGDFVRVYEQVDDDWWFVKQDDNVGLVPASYLEVTQNQPQQTPGNDAEQQKALFLNALGGLGFAPKKVSQRENKGQIYGPDHLKYYPVTELDKKKKKNNKKGLLGVCQDEKLIYFLDFETKEIIHKIPIADLTKNKDKKTILKLEYGKDHVHEFEGDKNDIKALHESISNPSGKQDSPQRQTSVKDSPSARESAVHEVPKMVMPVKSIQPIPEKKAIALYDYTPVEAGEIEMRENEELIVIDDSDPDWTTVRLQSGVEGLVPRTYIEFSAQDTSNRQEEQRLELQRQEQQRLEEQRREEQRREQQRLEEQRREEQRREEQRREEQRREEEKRAPVLPSRPNPVIPARPDKTPQLPARPNQESIPKPALPDSPAKMAIPVIPSRPEPKNEPARPVLPARDAVPVIPKRETTPVIPQRAQTPVIPKRSEPEKPTPPPMPSRPVAPTSRPVKEEKPKQQEMPDQSKLRQWTDKTGSFSVDAVYLGISDGKVQLHKSNGVKIAVPLEKLDQKAIDYLKTQPGNEMLSVSSGPVAAPLPPKGKSGSSNMLNQSSPEFIYNSFDWRDWLIKAGVSSQDATTYARKFVEQKMDNTILSDIDRETLRSMSISEGDIIRIRKAANLPTMTAAVQNKAMANEKAAEANNLKLLMSKQTNRQIQDDEQLARQLQEQENALGRNNSVNPSVLKQAGNLLNMANARPVTNNGPVSFNTLPSTQSVGTASSLGLKNSTSSNSISNDPWGGKDQTRLQQEEAAKSLQQAQQAMLKAQEQARQAQLLEQQTQAMKLQQAQNEAALKQAQETAKRAMLMQQQAEQALLNAQKSAQQTMQQSMMPQVQPVQPVIPMAVPLIPTPGQQPVGGFVPLPAQQRGLVGNMNQPVQTMVGPQGVQKPNWQQATPNQPFGQKPQDPYAAFKDAAPNAPSVFNQSGPMNNIPTGSSINPSSSVSNYQGQYAMQPQMTGMMPQMANTQLSQGYQMPVNQMQRPMQQMSTMSGMNSQMTPQMNSQMTTMTPQMTGMGQMPGMGGMNPQMMNSQMTGMGQMGMMNPQMMNQPGMMNQQMVNQPMNGMMPGMNPQMQQQMRPQMQPMYQNMGNFRQ
ncbi:hypothetical protein EDD86DRAFT_268032 [Gorgonomyces haynaldii]|nr:hypothetical protein EDD86DRAFT_268032 [Gorgonomyces haynaldii]